MDPIIQENYILTKDSYFGFTLDQNKKALDKNRKGIKITSYFQIIVGVLFIVSMVFSGQKIGILYIVLAAALIVTGFSGSMRIKGYEKKITASLEKSYETREYGKNLFNVKFFEDKLSYTVGDQSGELSYDDFSACYEGENYFATHFETGEVLIYNRTCNIKRIQEILEGYKEAHPYKEPSDEETILTDAQIQKKEELADDWYMNIEDACEEARDEVIDGEQG